MRVFSNSLEYVSHPGKWDERKEQFEYSHREIESYSVKVVQYLIYEFFVNVMWK